MLFMFRVMQDRREQARQDLKGLEETVVSSFKSADDEKHFTVALCRIS